MSIVDECQISKLRTSYRSIVVGIDDTPRSDSAVVAAARLAKDACATLTIAGTYPKMRPSEWAHVSDILRHDAYNATPASAVEALLAAAATRARAAGAVKVDRCSMPGTPIEALLAAVTSTRADLVVVGERVFDTPWGRFFGSFHAEMTRRSTADVLIVRSAFERPECDGKGNVKKARMLVGNDMQ